MRAPLVAVILVLACAPSRRIYGTQALPCRHGSDRRRQAISELLEARCVVGAVEVAIKDPSWVPLFPFVHWSNIALSPPRVLRRRDPREIDYGPEVFEGLGRLPQTPDEDDA